jgi:hypothetical protein
MTAFSRCKSLLKAKIFSNPSKGSEDKIEKGKFEGLVKEKRKSGRGLSIYERAQV